MSSSSSGKWQEIVMDESPRGVGAAASRRKRRPSGDLLSAAKKRQFPAESALVIDDEDDDEEDLGGYTKAEMEVKSLTKEVRALKRELAEVKLSRKGAKTMPGKVSELVLLQETVRELRGNVRRFGLISPKTGLNEHLWENALVLVKGFLAAEDSMRSLQNQAVQARDLASHLSVLKRLQKKIENNDPPDMDQDISKRNQERENVSILVQKIVKQGSQDMKAEWDQARRILSKFELASQSNSNEFTVDPVLSEFEAALRYCSGFMDCEASWRSRYDIDSIQAKSEEALSLVKSSVEFLAPSEALEEHRPLIENALALLEKEKDILTRVQSGVGVPLPEMIESLKRVVQVYGQLKKDAQEVSAKLLDCENYLGRSQVGTEAPSLSALRSLEKQFFELNEEMFSRTAAANINKLKMDVRFAPKGSDAEKEAQEKLRLEEENLDSLKREVQIKLDSIIPEFVKERKRLLDQSALFPELAFDQEWGIVFEGLNTKDLSSLDLSSREDAADLLSGSREVKQDCPVCAETVDQSNGILCENDHFICNGCLQHHLSTLTQPGYDRPLRADGTLPCYDPTCTSKTFAAKTIAEHVGDEVYSNYMKSLSRLIEAKTIQENDRRWKAEIEKRERMEKEKGEIEHRIQKHVEHIRENIFTTKCPRGGHAFYDFDGCFALTCTQCKPHSAFCGWCLADCGSDAHQHVSMCPQNLTRKSRGPRDLYGTKEMFLQSVQNRISKRLKTYWNEKVKLEEPVVQWRVHEMIATDLKDLNMTSPVKVKKVAYQPALSASNTASNPPSRRRRAVTSSSVIELD